jgi:hypothetical protein
LAVRPTHIALHLQRIALFSLPQVQGSEINSTADGAESDQAIDDDERDSIDIKDSSFFAGESKVRCLVCKERRDIDDVVQCTACSASDPEKNFCDRHCAMSSCNHALDCQNPGQGHKTCWEHHRDALRGLIMVLKHEKISSGATETALQASLATNKIHKSQTLLSYLDEAGEFSVLAGSAAEIAAAASLGSNADATMLAQYNELQQQTTLENFEMGRAKAFWTPLESMSKKDATY